MLSKFTAIGGLSGNDAARNQNDMQGLAALSSSTPHRPARKPTSHPHHASSRAQAPARQDQGHDLGEPLRLGAARARRGAEPRRQGSPEAPRRGLRDAIRCAAPLEPRGPAQRLRHDARRLRGRPPARQRQVRPRLPRADEARQVHRRAESAAQVAAREERRRAPIKARDRDPDAPRAQEHPARVRGVLPFDVRRRGDGVAGRRDSSRRRRGSRSNAQACTATSGTRSASI